MKRALWVSCAVTALAAMTVGPRLAADGDSDWGLWVSIMELPQDLQELLGQ